MSGLLCYVFRDETLEVLSRRVYYIFSVEPDYQGGASERYVPPGPRQSRNPTRRRMNWHMRLLQINGMDNDDRTGGKIPRRIVLLVTLVSKFFQCFVKISNNQNYNMDYVTEVEVNDYFRSVRLDPSMTHGHRRLC